MLNTAGGSIFPFWSCQTFLVQSFVVFAFRGGKVEGFSVSCSRFDAFFKFVPLTELPFEEQKFVCFALWVVSGVQLKGKHQFSSL